MQIDDTYELAKEWLPQGKELVLITTNTSAGIVVVNGKPTGAGIASFTVTVTDTNGATANSTITLTVNAALTLTPGAVSQATAGTATNQTLTIGSGTTPYASVNISNFNPGTTGLISGSLSANAP